MYTHDFLGLTAELDQDLKFTALADDLEKGKHWISALSNLHPMRRWESNTLTSGYISTSF